MTRPSYPKPCRYTERYGHLLRSHELNCRDPKCEGCQPCTHDEHGNVVRHCEARKSCGRHLDAAHPHTCPKCIGETRADVLKIVRMSQLLTAAAVEAGGVGSQPANLAGPSADPYAWTKHRQAQIRSAQGLGGTSRLLVTATGERKLPDDQVILDEEDPHHPKAVLGRWEAMLREHYHQRPTHRAVTIQQAADYLTSVLGRFAQDPDQDWQLFVREIRVCRSHLEDILNTTRRTLRGAPCPNCVEAPPLVKQYAHWCTRENCDKEHDLTGAKDHWRCPKCGAQWTEAEYRLWVTDDYLDNADALTAPEIQMVYGIKASTLRTWAERGQVKKRGRNASGQRLYDVEQARALHEKSQQRGQTA